MAAELRYDQEQCRYGTLQAVLKAICIAANFSKEEEDRSIQITAWEKIRMQREREKAKGVDGMICQARRGKEKNLGVVSIKYGN